jgi:cytochrome c-type biogenesis protein CcmH/NrfG
MTAFLILAAAMLAVALAVVVPSLAGGKSNGKHSRAAWIVALAISLGAGTMYFFLGTPRALDSGSDTADGWRTLARSYETTGRVNDAVNAYRRLQQLRPNDAGMLVDYAVTLAMSRGRGLAGEPEKLIARALEIDPENIQALSLAGSAAFDRGDYQGAVRMWRRVLTLVPAGSDAAASIADSISKAEAMSR